MDLRSGSNHIMFPSIVHMGMSHEKSLYYGIPSRIPPESYLMEDVSCINSPFIDPRMEGALEDHTSTLRVWGKNKEREIIFLLTSLSILSSHTALRKDAARMEDDTIMKQGRQSLN